MEDTLRKRLKFREWDKYDLSEDTAIDKYNLDICAERQGANMLKWQELLVQANGKLTKAKEALTYVESQLLLEARQKGVPGVEKMTDAVVKAWVTVQDRYRSALKRKIGAESDVAYINAGIKALEHCKEMIKVETNLWICGYYARPKINEAVSEEQLEMRQQDTANVIRETLDKRKRRE